MGTPGAAAKAIIEKRVDDLLLVDEGDIEQAVLMLLEIEKTLVEGAGAEPGWRRCSTDTPALAGKRGVGLVPGGNIDPAAGRHHRARHGARRPAGAVRVSARDVPGSLARITAVVGEAGANIDEVHHQRLHHATAQNVEIEPIVIQTRGREHIAAVLGRCKCRV